MMMEKKLSLSVIYGLILLAFIAGSVISFSLLPAPQAFVHSLYLVIALHICLTDFREYRIHKYSLFAALLLGIVYVFISNNSTGLSPISTHFTKQGFQQYGYLVILSLLRAVCVFIIFWIINKIYKRYRGITGIAEGDLWLFAIAAIWLPLEYYPTFILMACIGTLTAIAIKKIRQKRKLTGRTQIPFGAFMSIALWMVILMGKG